MTISNAERFIEGIEAKIDWENSRPSWRRIAANAAVFIGMIALLIVGVTL